IFHRPGQVLSPVDSLSDARNRPVFLTMAFVVPALAAIGGGSAVAGGAMLATVAAAGVSAYGTIQQGKAQQKEANYAATIDDNNAISAGYAAIQQGQAAQREAEGIREERLRNLGSQRAAAAHAGLTISG